LNRGSDKQFRVTLARVTTLHPVSLYFDLEASKHQELFAGVGNVWEALGKHLEAYLKKTIRPGILGKVEPGAFLVGDDIQIGKGTVVEAGAYIKGPTIIGENCEIRHGAYIRGTTLCEDNCVVGHTTEVKGSVFLRHAKAGHFAYVGDSILGADCNLGAGTKLANFKLTGDAVAIPITGGRINTGQRKLGAILGDRVQTGCNSVTSPGTLLGRASFVYPCVSVRAGIYPNGSRLAK
jgi:NDP-sugar pyrophosphorylase family protein